MQRSEFLLTFKLGLQRRNVRDHGLSAELSTDGGHIGS
jgi:hypothetical protein